MGRWSYGLFRGSPSFYDGKDTDVQDQIKTWSEREKANIKVGGKDVKIQLLPEQKTETLCLAAIATVAIFATIVLLYHVFIIFIIFNWSSIRNMTGLLFLDLLPMGCNGVNFGLLCMVNASS